MGPFQNSYYNVYLLQYIVFLYSFLKDKIACALGTTNLDPILLTIYLC